MYKKIKKVIDTKVKNLEPTLEKSITKELIDLNITSEIKMLSYIRNKLKLPRQGKYTKIYWKNRGWSENDIEKKRPIYDKNISPMKVEHWLNKINKKTNKKYTIDEAKYKIKSHRKLNKEYWLEKGYSEKESILKVKEYQTENSNKFVEKITNNKELYKGRTHTQLQYWINKGLSKEEAKSKLSEIQNTVSLGSMIKKYGDKEGLKKYSNNVEKIRYTSSRKYYIDKYGKKKGNDLYDSILNKRIVPMSKASKESFYFFIPIYKFLRKHNISQEDIYWGVGKSNEWFINTKENMFFYDFTIKELDIIIEYNGIKFHPKEGQYEWKCIYSNKTYDEKIKLDNIKKNIAIKKGFHYIEVFSDENLTEKQNEIIELLKNKINEYG